MVQLSPYLHFNGTCRAAMTFYGACLGGELVLQAVGATPLAARLPPALHDHILHATLTAPGITLLASDMLGTEGVIRGNTITVCLHAGDKDELQGRYDQLAVGGMILHPLKDEFFGTYGDLIDRFGIGWMFQAGPG